MTSGVQAFRCSGVQVFRRCLGACARAMTSTSRSRSTSTSRTSGWDDAGGSCWSRERTHCSTCYSGRAGGNWRVEARPFRAGRLKSRQRGREVHLRGLRGAMEVAAGGEGCRGPPRAGVQAERRGTVARGGAGWLGAPGDPDRRGSARTCRWARRNAGEGTGRKEPVPPPGRIPSQPPPPPGDRPRARGAGHGARGSDAPSPSRGPAPTRRLRRRRLAQGLGEGERSASGLLLRCLRVCSSISFPSTPVWSERNPPAGVGTAAIHTGGSSAVLLGIDGK